MPWGKGGKGYCPRPGRRQVFCFLIKGVPLWVIPQKSTLLIPHLDQSAVTTCGSLIFSYIKQLSLHACSRTYGDQEQKGQVLN